jgi:hypothetical protein
VGAAPFGGDAVATDGETVEPGVGAGSLVDGADVLGDAVATDGEVMEPGVGARSLIVADGLVPESAAAIAQFGVGAGSLSESGDESGGAVAPVVDAVGALAAMSAQATGIGESEAKAAAPSAIAETRRTLWVIETSISSATHSAPRKAPSPFSD